MIRTLIALAAVHAQPPLEIDAGRFLRAVAEVEGHRWEDPGGRYAFTATTWRDRTRLPYRLASSPAHAEHVAGLHLAWIARELRASGYPVNAYTLAACWHLGAEGFKRRRAVLDYAVRVENLTRKP
jgi:hypothetical protein